ncbi:hypothetical protein C8263_17740 [Deinococcus arcticus]|uniref:Uncharacterized protein n=1 Tax=Deinococcus arcticus TaxID=2136176 RepID=A0A2T3W3K0_9DEIO|nr:hypothetical protein C8263_17740 [Deinococcus arcticus]
MLDMMRSLATENLGLTPITCADAAFRRDPTNACYAAPYSADEFMTKAETLLTSKGFSSVTGWRDDYGVASTAVQYRGTPQRIGMYYARPTSFWDQPRYAELRALKAQGQVMVSVSETDPAERAE